MTWSYSSIDGAGDPFSITSFMLGDNFAWSYSSIVASRVAANGKQPCSVDSIGPYIGGYGASRVATCYIEAAGGGARVDTAAFSIPSDNANYRGQIALPGAGYVFADVAGGVTFRVGYDANGSFRIGRATKPGNNIYNNEGVAFAGNALGGVLGYSVVPDKPTGLTATQVGVSSLKFQWTPPADTGGQPLTGYLLQFSKDPTFATGVTQVTVGAVTQYTASSLTSGRWYVRLGAVNIVATAAGTCGPWATVASATIVAETGDLDSWQQFGGLPAGVEGITAQGLRRAAVTTITGAPLALLKENNPVSGSPTLAANTYGAKRAVSGLTPGLTYRLSATAAITEATPADTYQLGVIGIGWADALELAAANEPEALPVYEFIATASTHEIAVRLAAAAALASGGTGERLALYGLVLAQIPSNSPYRLASTIMESSLANHFDMANNSVNARWWVDANNVTQFAADLGTASPVATFTDVRQDGKLEYVGIARGYDTRNIVNDLTLQQHGAQVDPENPDDYLAADLSINGKDLTSIATWGIRSDSMDVSLYDEDAYAGSIAARLDAIITANAEPAIVITRLRWNAQDDPYVASLLDVYSPIDVEFRGSTQPSRIINIKHDISPGRWMMTMEIAPREVTA